MDAIFVSLLFRTKSDNQLNSHVNAVRISFRSESRSGMNLIPESCEKALSELRKNPVRQKLTADVVEYMESEKLCKPSIYTREIQQRLLLDGVSTAQTLPSEAGLKKSLREDCGMTKKKISQVPIESTSQTNADYTDYYLNEISQINFSNLHFFDESSVIVTSGNRNYGNSHKGMPAVEMQRYASNANFTVNLLHSALGVDYFSVLRGPSNGMEMLNFFNEALYVNRPDGSTILEVGDVVIMDNCGFHHGNFVEPLLRDILQEHGIRLLFQPAYSPHLNTCEYCFHEVKCYLRRNTELTLNETEIAITEGVGEISATSSISYFRKCGYMT